MKDNTILILGLAGLGIGAYFMYTTQQAVIAAPQAAVNAVGGALCNTPLLGGLLCPPTKKEVTAVPGTTGTVAVTGDLYKNIDASTPGGTYYEVRYGGEKYWMQGALAATVGDKFISAEGSSTEEQWRRAKAAGQSLNDACRARATTREGSFLTGQYDMCMAAGWGV